MNNNQGFDEAPVNDGFALIDEGTYPAKCTGYKLDQSVDPWRASFEFTLEDSEFKGQKVWTSYQVNEKGGPFLKADLQTMGIQDEVTSKTLLSHMHIAHQVDQSYIVYVKHREYNGKTYLNTYLNGVADTNPAASEAGGPPATDSKDNFAF